MTLSPNFYAIIPAPVRYCKELEMGARLLYGEITALTHEQGHCWASNAYFSERYEVGERTIIRWLKSLQDKEFISVTFDDNVAKSGRKIWISSEVKNVIPLRQKCHTPLTKMSYPYDKNVVHNSKESIKEEREREGASPPPPPYSPSFYIERRVKIELNKYKKLIEDFGEAKVNEMMDRLDEYADLNPKRFKQYACHGAVIRKWIREDSKSNPGKGGNPAKNRLLAEHISRTHSHFFDRNEIEIHPNHIQFNGGQSVPTVIFFDDALFSSKLKPELDKRRIDSSKYVK